jgi:hypothetical protein
MLKFKCPTQTYYCLLSFRIKLGVLAKMLNITSMDGFYDMFGPKWAYHPQPVIALIQLPYYENMKLARMNGGI